MKKDKIFDDFKKNIEKIYNTEEIEKITKAYEFAKQKHANKMRKTNEEYITHPVAVAEILLDLNVDYVTICAALLHETINHGATTFTELEETFGKEIANIVNIVSKINKLKLNDDRESSSIYLRKIVVGLSEDVRVLFIKLADRLHNMRTIWALSPNEQKQKANETMNVLIPIAHRLGIHSIKVELEDLCLKYLKPDVYEEIKEELASSEEELNEILQNMKENICELLLENDIKFEIKARVKSIYSIYNKMQNNHKFKDIYDILALRLILEKESDCYLAVGLIHSKFRPLPNRFKDYISMPKENMYQSIHTTVFGVDGYIFEIQLRTHEMNEIAEHGIASHWSYKEHGSAKIQSMMEQKLEIFRNIINENSDNDDKDLNETINQEFLSNLIYCFTPKGDVVELPDKSSPVDFAYRIHSEVGNTTVGAIVNDKQVPLNYELKDGDIIKIQTNKTATPSLEWLNFIKTSQAKNKIKAYFSKQERNTYEEKGKKLLEKELRKQKKSFNEFNVESNINKILNILKLKDINEVYFSIGSFRYTASYIISLTDEKSNKKDILIDKMISHPKESKINHNSDILVEGIDDIKVNLAKCCMPIKGDDIIGFVTKGSGISVHKKDCINIKEIKDRLINVSWNDSNENDYLTKISINTNSLKDILFDIIKVFSLLKINVVSFEKYKIDNFYNYKLQIKIKNIDEYKTISKELLKISSIKHIERT